MEYIKRELEKNFLEASSVFKAVLITGARQIGKSTMLRHLASDEHRTVISMDKASARELAKNDPELFFQTFKPPILIDEVQKAPELFEQIKIICDSTDEKGLFWLTGSESRKLLDHAEDSLAGRIAILKMYPLSAREKSHRIECEKISYSYTALSERQSFFPCNDIHDTYLSIWRGGMPDVQNLSEKMLAVYFDSYIENYLMRDAIDDNGIRDTEGFRRFLRACAAFTGQLLNYTDLATAASVSVNTAKEWVKILQSMGILFILEPYSNNELKRMIKTPKLYFCDTGLCAYLSRWQNKDVLMEGAASGHYYENYIVMEFVKNLSCNDPRSVLSYYRDKDSKEIDLILEDHEGLHPFEIKKAAKPDNSEVKKFSVLEKCSVPLTYGGIICMCTEPFPIDRMNCLIPGNLI